MSQRVVRVGIMVIAAAVAAAFPAHAARPAGAAVRSSDAAVAALMSDACQRSASFRRIVAEIANTDGIVYVQPGTCPTRGMRGCLLHKVDGSTDVRYLWVRVSLDHAPITIMSTIAHELQHAIEILAHRRIRSGLDILHFYRSTDARHLGARRGEANGRSYETMAALQVGDDVRSELLASPTAPARLGECEPLTAETELRDAAER